MPTGASTVMPEARPTPIGDLSPVWLGIDLGTTGVRALAVSDAGVVLGRGGRLLESRRSGPRHVQAPRAWWEAVGGACRDALREISPPRVHGVATCATSGTILLVDARGAPLTPALMYDDTRATAQSRRIDAAPSSALPKVLWLLDSHPALAARARLAHQPDYIARRLLGHDVPSDSSHALKSGYDLVAERWPPAVREILPPDLLPDVVRPGTVLGSVCPAAAAHTGIAPGTPVIAGMTDGCAAQIAAGALRVGDWSSVLGTTLVLKGVSPAPVTDPAGVLYSHRAPDGEWLPGGASSSGAGALRAAFPGRDLDELTRQAAGHEATPVLAYPLVGRGERFPFCAPLAEAFVTGRPTGDGELFAALLHGLAFVERLCFDVLDLAGAPLGGDLTLGGAAAANQYLCQLRADVLARPLRLVEHGESAFGAAILAASHGRPLAHTAAGMVRPRRRFEPEGARHRQLAERYEDFVGELHRRDWLGPEAADHARGRLSRGG